MKAYKCSECGYKSITKKYYCPECRATAYEIVDVSGDGTVYSYTTIHIAPPEFADLAPYQVVLIELSNKLKVTGFMKDKVNIGDKVTIKEIKDSTYVFEKVS
ncbi:Zn-ribbon domain-containing OB-fold protein [Ornithinibacillus salinisoli]|uniref:Zn-ribbon domain-containing OB-fold protein n=1 Tax=Ornithinibacillus salinisoli TaxID=1848459 RepID=A0ABW4VZ86_9BACI